MSTRLAWSPSAAAPAAPTAPTRPDTEREPERRTRLLPPYKVLLHNDDVNSMDHVVRSLLRSVPNLGRAAALRIMLEAHLTGVALVTVCPLELAELYRERLESCGLTATIEPA
jgi:ATP-dependent Clp protease adaptor protein ClpS